MPAAHRKAPKPSPRANPAAVYAESTKAVDEIEARFKKNNQDLKKYYGTAEKVKQATGDLIRLAVVQGLYAKSNVAEEKSLAQHAEVLTRSVTLQQRTIYASALEEIFVKSGMDVGVTAAGIRKDQLKLKYVLMSKPLVYKFQNEIKIDEQARLIGFKRIVFSDGYDETWTIDL